jgi:peptidoglycan hydrolase CwlO-like protein
MVRARPQTLHAKGTSPCAHSGISSSSSRCVPSPSVVPASVAWAARSPLRAKPARVQAAIDRMNARVERLVEDYNEVREALARARVEQARTREQVLDARRLRVARRQLGERLWTIYTGGAPSTLGQLLGADSIHQALVTTRYQEEVVGADRAAIDRVEQLRRQVEALAAKLADQAERQELLQARLAASPMRLPAMCARSSANTGR